MFLPPTATKQTCSSQDPAPLPAMVNRGQQQRQYWRSHAPARDAELNNFGAAGGLIRILRWRGRRFMETVKDSAFMFDALSSRELDSASLENALLNPHSVASVQGRQAGQGLLNPLEERR